MDPISVAVNALLMLTFELVLALAAVIGGNAAATPLPEPAAIVITDDRAMLPVDEDW